MELANTTVTAGGSALRRLRPLLVFSIATLLALSVVVTLAARMLMASFETVEREATRQKAEQVYRAFEADLRQLAISNRDYAEWDDAERFVTTSDASFLTANFSADAMASMHVDLVWVAARDGENLYSAWIDPATGKKISPAPQKILAELREFQTRNTTLRARSPGERTALTAWGLTAISAMEVTRSDHSNPTGAVMLFARLIEDDEIGRMRETSQLPVAMHYLDGRSGADLPADVAAWAATNAANQLAYVHVVDNERIAGYAVVRDPSFKPIVLFETSAPREITAIGARTTWFLLGSIGTLLAALAVVAVTLVRQILKLQKLDLEHRRRAEEQQRTNHKIFTRQAQQDALTGLPNRFYLRSRLPRLLRKVADAKRLLAVVHVDIDHFKNLNDSRGHSSGDQLLRIVARRLRTCVAQSDLITRIGGDEFIIVASLLPDIGAIERFAERVQTAISADMNVDEAPMKVTASLGIAVYPRDGVDAELLLKRADIALHQAKDAGRSCYRFFTTEMDTRINEHVELEQALRRAIGTRQFFLAYQPIVDLKRGRVVSLEALMRWRHPEMGLIPPARFIPVAEKSGLIVELGQFALREVMQQQRAWLNAKVPIVPIAVNVSPLQIERLDFADHVQRLSAEIGVKPRWIRFEVTESAMVREQSKLVGTLRALRELGSRVLIDDFGTGYSSLSYLDKLPIDILKIDRAFVRDLGGSERAPIIEAILDIAKRLGIETVAEGVETVAQAARLQALGCHYAQGFLYSKAVPAEQCRAMLEHLKRERPLTETLVQRVVGLLDLS